MMETLPRDLDLKTQVGDKKVSTVALRVDHGGERYETMIFRCDSDGTVTSFSELFCARYATREQAEQGHASTVAALRDGALHLHDDETTS